MEQSIIDNIIIKHTQHQVNKYSGASLQSLLTHNNTKLTYKLTLFFGYNKSKNSISETIEITEQQYLTLTQVIADKNNDLLSTNKQLLSDDELFGVTTSLRRCNDPTNTILPTINTNTLNTNTKKKLKKEKTSILDEYDDNLKPTVKLIIEHRDEMKKPITKRGVDMLIKKLKHYAEHWNISNREALEFWLGEKWQGIDVEYKYPFRVSKKENQPQSFSEIKQIIGQKKSVKTKPLTLDELKKLSVEESNVH